jgi:hypothetical protein
VRKIHKKEVIGGYVVMTSPVGKVVLCVCVPVTATGHFVLFVR